MGKYNLGMKGEAMERVVIFGTTGEVGLSIAQSFLEAGFIVLAPTRNIEKLGVLADEHLPPKFRENLKIVKLDFQSQKSCAELKKTISEFAPNGVVNSLGGWFQGPSLSELETADFDKVISDNLKSHFLAAQCSLPALEKQNSNPFYVMIGGGAAFHVMPGSAIVSVAAAAQIMLIEAFAKENQNKRIRFFEPVLMTPVITRSRQHDNSTFISAKSVGELCLSFARTNQAIQTVRQIKSSGELSILISELKK